ncbi:MAG: FHA domain-containing protein [Bdellovibrionales bacterium]|nr:FHA domain-containing protein [Bdellovibrionales bacterium]
MALMLKILQGPLTGQTFNLIEGLQIGRKNGLIRLEDSKVSGTHAEVRMEEGHLTLNDLGSKNGIRVGPHRRDTLILSEGLRFSIGDSVFEVVQQPEPMRAQADDDDDDDAFEPTHEKTITKIDREAKTRITRSHIHIGPSVTTKMPTSEQTQSRAGIKKETFTKELASKNLDLDATRISPRKAEALSEEPAPVPLDPEPEQRRTWTEVLTEWVEDQVSNLSNHTKVIAPFSKPLSLTFLSGLQADTVWTLGYGPRIAGPKSIDLPILDPGAPDPCFELFPTLSGVQFKTEYPDVVMLNGEPTDSGPLKSGDQISVNEILIEVEFNNDQNS